MRYQFITDHNNVQKIHNSVQKIQSSVQKIHNSLQKIQRGQKSYPHLVLLYTFKVYSPD